MSFLYCPGYNAEGQTDGDPRWVLEEPTEVDVTLTWYFDYFYGKDHKNFIASTQDTPLVLSLRSEKSHYRVIIRTNKGSERFLVPKRAINSGLWRYVLVHGPRVHRVLNCVKPEFADVILREITDPKFTERLRLIDEPKTEKTFKIGLLYARADQNDEKEMFNNVTGSPEYEEFLDFLGQRVNLLSFSGFNGGLDIENNLSGEQSVYTIWQNVEIMFHVSTLLPYVSNDAQQLERKKHIGNDRVLLVFKDGDAPLSPETVHSKQNHIIGLVQPYKKEGARSTSTFYKFSVASRSSVPRFEPAIPEPPIFQKGPAFRDFLFTKLFNGLAATNHTSEFKPLTMLHYKKMLIDLVAEFSQTKPSPY